MLSVYHYQTVCISEKRKKEVNTIYRDATFPNFLFMICYFLVI